ncbi:MAG: Mur ligase family protein [Microgenomates group bacterium]
MQNSICQLASKIQKIKNFFHLLWAVLANIYYQFPSRRLKVIGVTGTDGKTTTTHLIYHILKSAGKKVSLISTVYAKVGNQEFDTGLHTTTPGPFFIQRFLKRAADSGDQFFVLETTSHALDQNRVWGVKYEIGVITNITHEHLDYHQTYEEYVKTKLKLLKMAKIALVNKDDQSYRYIKDKISNISYPYKISKIIREIPGLAKFNQYNYSAAYFVCKQLGVSDEVILKAMKSFKLPSGRMELVYDGSFKVLIDFAHTPNAFAQILPEVRMRYLRKGGKLIHVFGAAGLRDFSKRPLMGEVSGKFADMIIITEEDYRTEDLYKICQQIGVGIAKQGIKLVDEKFFERNDDKIYTIITNRQKAINKAIKIAKKGDVILITGKAHEKSLCRGKIEYPWDEYKAVKKALKIYKLL